MKRKCSVLLAVTSASILALGALPSSSGAADLGDTCDALIGSHVGTINLAPLVNVNYATCKAATVPRCSSPQHTIDLGVVRVTYALCNPINFGS
jgi:hypothetical protein